MSKITKQTIDALCTELYITMKEKERKALTEHVVLDRIFSDLNYSSAQIDQIITSKKIKNPLQACMIGCMLNYVEKACKQICSYEGKTYGEICDCTAQIIANDYKASTLDVDIYDQIQQSLDILVSIGRVKVHEREYEGKHLYEYVVRQG